MDSASRPSAAGINKAIKQALRYWHQERDVDPIFTHFYLYRKLLRKTGGNTKLALKQFLLEGLTLLQGKYEQAAQLLQARFLDGLPIQRIMNQMNLAESTLYVLQRQAINSLVETIIATEQMTTATQKAVMLERLGSPSYVELVGVEEQLTQLQTLVVQDGPPWLIAIEGIGGIGKTALANALLQRLIQQDQVDDVGWLSAQHERLTLMGKLENDLRPALTSAQLIEGLAKQLLPGSGSTSVEHQTTALRARLKELPHVIVIDNLETVIDVESLLPTLQMLANPTKFVLTSRESLFGVPNLYHARVEQLPLPAALHLIRQEAALRGLPVLAMGSDAELEPIFATVGGNPLALRLVVGQTHVYGLQSILYDLHQARSNTADNFYTYIYQKAWEKLDPLGRRALLVMPLASPRGDNLAYLAEVGDLDVDELRMALNQLVSLNLVDAYGGLHNRCYSIHSLTRTFLEKQVIKWL